MLSYRQLLRVQAPSRKRFLSMPPAWYARCMKLPLVACPLCRLDAVRITGTVDDLILYCCEACGTQFGVTIPRPPRPATSPRRSNAGKKL